MTPIFDGIEFAQGGDIGTIVYVGAGDGQHLSLMLPFVARRIVLAEGDPTALTKLQTSAAAFPLADVHGVVLSPHGGRVRWHRYNLDWLNGPTDLSALSSYYPRLRSIGFADVQAEALDDWLRGLDIAVDTSAHNLLVLDLPGQEANMLTSLSTGTIQLFEWIVVRGCAFASDPACVVADAMRPLEEAGFRASQDTVSTEPLWPTALAIFDAASWQLTAEARRRAEQDALLQIRLAELEALVAADVHTRQDLQFRIDVLTESLGAARAQIEQREQAHRAAFQARDSAAADAQARVAQQTQANLEVMAKQMEQAQERELQRVQEELSLAQAREEETAEFRVQLTEAAAREAALLAKVAVAEAERAAVAESLQAQIRRADDGELRAAALAAEVDAVRRDTADLISQLGDARSRIDVLAAEAVSLREKLAISQLDNTARVATISAECDAARRASADVQFQLSESRTRQDSLAAENASLREQLTATLQSHDQVRRDAEAARRDAEAVRHEADDRLREAAKRDQGLRDEIVRAEAQLDLVKDLLLREPGL